MGRVGIFRRVSIGIGAGWLGLMVVSMVCSIIGPPELPTMYAIDKVGWGLWMLYGILLLMFPAEGQVFLAESRKRLGSRMSPPDMRDAMKAGAFFLGFGVLSLLLAMLHITGQ
jgi:hypothetical protein